MKCEVTPQLCVREGVCMCVSTDPVWKLQLPTQTPCLLWFLQERHWWGPGPQHPESEHRGSQTWPSATAHTQQQKEERRFLNTRHINPVYVSHFTQGNVFLPAGRKTARERRLCFFPAALLHSAGGLLLLRLLARSLRPRKSCVQLTVWW